MNFCSNCGNELNNNETHCINCGTSIKNDINNNMYLDIDNRDGIKEKIEKREKKSKTPFILAIISFILALLPILLILYCFISCLIVGGGNGLVFLVVLLYYFQGGIINTIASVILGIISYKKQKNKLALWSIVIDILPFLLFAVLFIIL